MVDFCAKGKHITLFKISDHIEGNEATAKEAIKMPGMTITRLSYTDYFLVIRRAKLSECQKRWETFSIELHNIKPHIKE